MSKQKPSSLPPRYSVRDLAERFEVPVNTLQRWLEEDGAPEPCPPHTQCGMCRTSAGGKARRFYHLDAVTPWLTVKKQSWRPTPQRQKRDIRNKKPGDEGYAGPQHTNKGKLS